jgi:alkylation response protein AidB-like acyl-CoA dehydrogenase
MTRLTKGGEHRALAKTALEFSRNDVLPHAARIEGKDFPLLKELIRRAGELGLLGIDIDEAHGGLGLDATATLLVAESKSLLGSWSVTFGAQTCIGTLPIAFFGTEAQKAKYLPHLCSGALISAYALTEAGSGSDALGAKTRATRSADGRQWILNGSKQYITNAGFADVFVVFAKVDGEKFSAFIVDRDTPGFSVGPEEHKMGIRGSSTCPLTFEDARIPVENLLGAEGRGHVIAFNILNLGRLKLGAGVLGSMKHTLAMALDYVTTRAQFATPLIRFGLTREKLARMTAAIYAVESMAYRTAGLIDAHLAAGASKLESVEQFVIEASIMKVLGSEALGQVVDDALQLHGGIGYIEGCPVERAYRDARINRIFEGTNEINRLLVTGTLLKRVNRGQLELGVPSTESTPSARLKQVAHFCLVSARERFGEQLDHHQLVLAAISDLIMEAYALDSVVVRNAQAEGAGWRTAVEQLCIDAGFQKATLAARKVLGSVFTGEALEAATRRANEWLTLPYSNAEATHELVATAVEAARGYPS